MREYIYIYIFKSLNKQLTSVARKPLLTTKPTWYRTSISRISYFSPPKKINEHDWHHRILKNRREIHCNRPNYQFNQKRKTKKRRSEPEKERKQTLEQGREAIAQEALEIICISSTYPLSCGDFRQTCF